MRDHVRNFPKQLIQGVERARQAVLESVSSDISHVILAGMGGSAISGSLAAALTHDDLRVPLRVIRDYSLPAWADEKTLVIASSYSGGTEETLSLWTQAGQQGCQRVAISTGGKLASECQAPLVVFDYASQPRAALGFSLAILLTLLERLDLLDRPLSEPLLTVAKALDERHEALARQAGELASNCHDALPLITAAEHLVPVAQRWVTQINENSKAWAVHASYPELNHNLIVGLPNPFANNAPAPQPVRIIQLESAHYHPQTQRRMTITADIFRQAGYPVTTVQTAPSQSRLEQLLETCLLGDYVSLALADYYNVDPTPVEAIEKLKTALATGP